MISNQLLQQSLGVERLRVNSVSALSVPIRKMFVDMGFQRQVSRSERK